MTPTSTEKRSLRKLIAFLLGGVLVLTIFALLQTPPAFAAPTNDMFTNATLITGATGSVTGTGAGATLEPGEPFHQNENDSDPAAHDHSVWYRWTAPASGRFEFLVSSSQPESNAVDIYTGTAVDQLSEASRWYCYDGTAWATYDCKEVDATAGTTYRISVDGYEASFQLSWRRMTAPANDSFSNATPLTGLSVELTAPDRGGDLATAEAGEPQHGGASYAPLHSLWYSWTSPWSARVTIFSEVGQPPHDACYDPHVVAVYTGTSVSALRPVAAAEAVDEGCWSATVTFTAKAATTYKIAVDAPWSPVPLHASLTAQPTCDINGTTGNDTIVGTPGPDVLCGLEGDDNIKGQGGNDLIIGGPGIDAANFANATAGVTANLTTGTATGQGTDTLQDIENLVGSPYPDKLDGNAGTNVLNGGAGGDALWGQANNDKLIGAVGDDTLGGGTGNDQVNGGGGIDTAHFGQATAVSVNLTTGTSSGEGSDVITLTENVSGSPGSDNLTGSAAANLLQGGGGNDALSGLGGNDNLSGAAGNDSLTGGAGTDTCDGGTGTDTQATCETRIAIP